MNNNERAAERITARSRKEDAVLGRVLAWFGAAVAAECILLLLNRYYINATTRPGEMAFQGALFHTFPTLTKVLAVVSVLCAIWFFLTGKMKRNRVLPGILFGVFACLFIFSFITYYFAATGVHFLCAVVPVIAVLALVYYLYQHEFFLISLLSTMGIVWLWAFRRGVRGHPTLIYAAAAIAAVVLLVAALGCFSAQKNGGTLRIGGIRLRALSPNTGCGMVYLTCGIVAIVVVASLLLGTTIAYYTLFAVVAWDFVMAVYYTVKLM